MRIRTITPQKRAINRRYDINNILRHRINRHIKDKELKIDLIKHILLAMLNIFPLQVLNLALIADNISFQLESLLGLAPKGNPGYLTGKESLR
jgi:DNA-binding transcriptional MerR regulator